MLTGLAPSALKQYAPRSSFCAARGDLDRDGPYALVPLMSARQKAEYLLGCFVWFVALAWFWLWWLEPAHNVDTIRFVLVSIVLAWITLLPLYFLWIFYGSCKPAGGVDLPSGSRVAMVVTKAPSEPLAVVAETLLAMLAQDFPHDTWLADEDPSPETLRWCVEHGVKVSTRRGRADYHRAEWPRRTRCKEGNLAYFYDMYGYELYDFVAQLDADHVPAKGYLAEVLRPFADPNVGYVSAPSICDKNASESWAARGRLYVEANMHGSLQAGYNGGWAPLCIGSHYAVRTAALKLIGGLGPELAEDHSTTLIMNANRWRGVHAIDAIAHGDGPNNFADLATQEFQWSRSLMTILIKYTPRYLASLPAHLKFQFLFSELWYPLFSIFMAAMYAMPIIALTSGDTFVNVSFASFLLHFVPISLVLIAMAYRWRGIGSYRPGNAKVLSWEATLFLFARWPWSLAGMAAAIRDWLTGSFVDFRVTPKGADKAGALPLRVLMPYGVLSVLSALPVILFDHVGGAKGFYIFGICNALIYAALLLVIVVTHAGENRLSLRVPSKAVFAQLLIAGLLFIPPIAATAQRGPDGLESLTYGSTGRLLTRVKYNAAGAGRGTSNTRVVRFDLSFLDVFKRIGGVNSK